MRLQPVGLLFGVGVLHMYKISNFQLEWMLLSRKWCYLFYLTGLWISDHFWILLFLGIKEMAWWKNCIQTQSFKIFCSFISFICLKAFSVVIVFISFPLKIITKLFRKYERICLCFPVCYRCMTAAEPFHMSVVTNPNWLFI